MRRVSLTLALALLVAVVAACAGQTPAQQPAAPAAQATSAPAPAAQATSAPAPAAPKATAPAAAGAAPAAKAPGGNVVRLNLSGYPDNLDPQQMSFANEIAMSGLLYEPLVRLGPDLKPAPGAAESWKVSDDGLTWTFTLRPGLKYSDGSPLTAKDFEYAYKRAADPRLAGEYQAETFIIQGGEAYGTADPKAPAEQLNALRDKMAVKAIDDTTLEFKLTQPAAYFPYIAYLWIGYPVKQSIVESKGEDWWVKGENQIGNGPFMLKELKEKELARFVPNPNWHGEKPAADEIQMRFITDSKVAFEAYRNGELESIVLAAEDLEAAQKDPVLSKEILRYPGGCTYALQFNEVRPPFDQKDARQAAGKSIDREAWVRDVLRGLGRTTTSWLPPDIPGYDASMGADLKSDPAAAKALWDKVGYNGELKLTYSSTPRNKVRFEFVADQLRKALGVSPVLDPVETTTYTALTKNVETSPQIFILGWCSDYPDPQNWLSTYWRSTSGFAQRVGYKNAEFDKLVDQADVEKDATKRLQLYQQAEKLMLSDVAASPLWNNENVFLVKPYVTTGKTTSQDSSFVGQLEPWKLGIQK